MKLLENKNDKQIPIQSRQEFILVNGLFCDTCKEQNSVIKVSLNLIEKLQYLFFQCLNPYCKRYKSSREYFSILPLIFITPEILIDQLKQQTWFKSSIEIENYIKQKMIGEK